MATPLALPLRDARTPVRRALGRRGGIVLALLVAAFVAAQLTSALSASAAIMTVDQCNNNGPGPSGATTSMQCTVVVVNTINGASRGSTTTLTRLCLLGPCAPGNGTFVSHSTALVTQVTQCNGSDNDSAHPITCDVTITNNISRGTANSTPRTAATVNQCVGSATGGGGTVNCDPFPATTTGATVTQCNGSGTGGGGTVHCTVDPASLVSPAVPITVNQCNGTGNPGGSVVTCTTRIRTNIVPLTGGSGSGSGSGSGNGAGNGSGNAAGSATGAGGGSGGQVSRVPTGGAETGGGSTAGFQDGWLAMAGGALLLCAGAGELLRRRTVRSA